MPVEGESVKDRIALGIPRICTRSDVSNVEREKERQRQRQRRSTPGLLEEQRLRKTKREREPRNSGWEW